MLVLWILNRKNQAENITTIKIYEDTELNEIQTVYNDKDSTYTMMFGSYDDIPDTTIYIEYVRNDTVYRENYSNGNKQHTYEQRATYYYVVDPSDKNTCIEHNNESSSTNSSTYWIEKNEDIIILYHTESIAGDSLVGKIYYSKINANANDNTSITRKFHPATVNKQYHYFDLLGRPAKGKNIIKVMK